MSSGRYVSKDGYVMIYVGKNVSSNGYIPEHILVMEKHLGRKLKRNEIVHHVDESFKARSNNDIKNLQLTNRPEHQRHHKPRKGTGKGYGICFHIRIGKWQLQILNKCKRWQGAGMYFTKEEALNAVESKYMLKVDNRDR